MIQHKHMLHKKHVLFKYGQIIITSAVQHDPIHNELPICNTVLWKNTVSIKTLATCENINIK